jgi:hypothetical protein
MQSSFNSSEKRTLNLPPSNPDSPNPLEIPFHSSIVVVGANGSGKTRFGSWIELNSPQKDLVHRISAQKSLTIPLFCPTSSVDIAQNSLLYGLNQNISVEQLLANKTAYRWNGQPNTFLQNDYQNLLTYLFTQEFDKSTQFRQQCKIAQGQSTPPETYLDIIKRIWESVLPHRELIIGAGKLEANPRNGGTSYHGSEMSDGERVIFYLIGQCLAVKENGIIVIDEPELHLHKALQSRLWDAVETERPDCLFVYLTHDLDFAVTRLNSIKIWLKSYDSNQWDWRLISESDGEGIPENLLLEIIGSRKPILFVEGDKNSLDFFIFSHLFKKYTVIPLGGCDEVIHATRSFSELGSIHGLECKGIIDRDFRTEKQIENLYDKGIFCLNYSEIENILLSEDVLKKVAHSLYREDIDELIEKVKKLVFDLIKTEKERLISSIVASRIEDGFKNFNAKALGERNLQNSLQQMLSTIDLPSLYKEIEESINKILDAQNYSDALRLYNNKGLLPQVSNIFQFQKCEFTNHIKRLILSKDNQLITQALWSSLPELSTLNQDEG